MNLWNSENRKGIYKNDKNETICHNNEHLIDVEKDNSKKSKVKKSNQMTLKDFQKINKRKSKKKISETEQDNFSNSNDSCFFKTNKSLFIRSEYKTSKTKRRITKRRWYKTSIGTKCRITK